MRFADLLGTYVSKSKETASSTEQASFRESDDFAYEYDRARAKRDASPDMYVMGRVAAEYAMSQIDIGRMLSSNLLNRRSNRN